MELRHVVLALLLASAGVSEVGLFGFGKPDPGESQHKPLEDMVPVANERSIAHFNKPDILHVNEPTEIKLVVSPDQIELIKIFHDLSGAIEAQPVNVGRFLSAKLTAPPALIEIIASDDRVQTPSKSGIVTFSWFVKALRVGIIPIRLDLYSQEKIGKDEPVSPVEVMQANWTADARGMEWITYNLAEYEPIRVAIWTLAAGVVSLVTFFGFRKRRASNGQDAPDRGKADD